MADSESDEDWDADFESATTTAGNDVGLTRKALQPARDLSSFADSDEESDGDDLDGLVLAATLNRKFGIQQKVPSAPKGETNKPTLITPEMMSKMLGGSVQTPSNKTPKESPLPGVKTPVSRLPNDSEVKKLRKLDFDTSTESQEGSKKVNPDEFESGGTEPISESLVQSLTNIKQVAQQESKINTDHHIRKTKDEVKNLLGNVTQLRSDSSSLSTTPIKTAQSETGSRSFIQILFFALLVFAVVGGVIFLMSTKQRQNDQNTFVKSNL